MKKFLIGGSPCTHWSIAQSKNRETSAEGIGWELFRNYLIAKEKFNHGGKVVARLRNKTLALNIDERGVNIEADLGGTTAGRELYEEIDGGYVDKMSFSFTVREAKYDSVTHTRTITKVKKLYDVSAVDIPAYNDTSISARSFFEEEHSRELAALEQARRRKKLVALTY